MEPRQDKSIGAGIRNGFIISFLLNAALTAVAVVMLNSRFAPAPVTATNEHAEQSGGITSSSNAPVASPVAAIKSKAPRNLNWREIESEDYKLYVARLRQIGCPEKTLRDIIVADVNKLYAKKRATIRAGSDDFVYWKAQAPYEADQQYYSKLRRERALEREKRALLIELLGYDPNEQIRRDNGVYEYLEWQFDFLSDSKRELARDIQEKYLDIQRERFPTNRGDPEVQRQMRLLFKQRLQELAGILTPDELEEYNLRSSYLGESLRHRLDGFNPTAEEFKQMFRILQPHESELEVLDRNDDAAVQHAAEVQAQADSEFQKLLGEERFAQYLRARDYNYKELTRLVQARDLPADTADKVYDIKLAAESEVRNIRQNQSLSAEEQLAALQKLRTDTTQAVTTLLGEKNLRLYERRSGSWLQRLR